MRESASNRPRANLPGFRGNTRRISGSRHRSSGPLPSSASRAHSLCRTDASASIGLVREATDSTESTETLRESLNPSGFTGSSEPTAFRSHRTLRSPPSSSELTATVHCLGFLRESPRALRSSGPPGPSEGCLDLEASASERFRYPACSTSSSRCSNSLTRCLAPRWSHSCRPQDLVVSLAC
jgi:hypothetical protein